MSDILSILRAAIAANQKIELLINDTKTDDIAAASELVIYQKNKSDNLQSASKYNLEDATNYTIDSKALSLRAIYNAWLHKDSSVADYISASQLKKIETINFKNKNDLINYLLSNTTSLPNAATVTPAAGPETSTSTSSESLAGPVNPAEAPLLHDSLFQGEKLINFNYLVKDAQIKIINQLKSDMRKSAGGRGGIYKPTASSLQKSKLKKGLSNNERPIILLSPSTSALIQMQNVKDFLENGVFKEPSTQNLNNNASNLLIVKKTLPILGQQKFLIVNSTEFFTKPEYWNRVVAIFTTGQSWQFKGYIHPDPEKLFQKYKGYYIGYEGDAINKNVNNWNVEVIKIDRNRRFNDKEVSEYFWANLEKSMIIKGHKKQ